jgi:hypothetical protein
MESETPRKRVSLDRLSIATIKDQNSVDSRELATQTYLGGTDPQASLAVGRIKHSSYTKTLTWKSQAVKDQEQYDRIRQRVRRFAPEQFKAHAKPGGEPSEIFPQNVAEWIVHKKEMLAMAEAENMKNCQLLKDQIEAHPKIPQAQRKIKSAFGEGGKTFTDIRTPVLAIGSIWARDNIPDPAPWPGKVELRSHADGGGFSYANGTWAGYLPHPRYPADIAAYLVAPGQEAPFFPQLPFDTAASLFPNGPDLYEMYASNQEMNSDPQFEAAGSSYMGSELMNEIGHWKPVFVPKWQQEQRAAQGQAMAVYDEDMMFDTPDVGDLTWQDSSLVSNTGDENQFWY